MYELSLVVRGQETARPGLDKEFNRSYRSAVPLPSTAVEQGLSKVLADDLRMPAESVRVYIGNRSVTYFDYVGRQLKLYARDGRDSPTVSGTVLAAIRQSDGRWQVFSRQSQEGFQDVWLLLRASPWMGALVLIPFSMWFSTRIARPVRAFAQAVGRIGGGREPFPVPVIGPNETQIAAIALNDMQSRILAFVRERTTLVGAIAHDLRTPLHNLRFRIAGAPDEIRATAESDIKQLDLLIDSILAYVENEGKPPTIEPLDLTSLLQSLVDDNSDLGRKITLAAKDVRVQGDLLMLRRLFSNLISNAFKFANSVSVSLKADASRAIIEILDDGPGMTAGDLERAFEPFFRGERSRNRETGGIGLGLSIARAIAEAHQGELSLVNGVSGGLLARVVLPLKQVEIVCADPLRS
jgi:signal transduction histidine kinase